jgi:histone H3/H4
MSEQETLVVISKMKKYIKDTGGMNTAASASSALSEIIRKACDKAIENAKSDKRKTVMDRDFQD